MSLTQYETVFILPADHAPQKIDEFVDKLKAVIAKGGGETTLVDKWGRRRLAYPIDRNREGFYVFLMFKAPGAVLAEVNQFFRVNEEVVRDIICKSPGGKPGSPTMNIPAPLMQTATTPYFRPPPAPAPGSVPAAAPAAAPSATPAPAAPVAAAPKEESHERPAAPAPAQ